METPRIIEHINAAGDWITLEDGFTYYDTGRGAIAAHHLRTIADELDRRNADWQRRLDELQPVQSAREIAAKRRIEIDPQRCRDYR